MRIITSQPSHLQGKGVQSLQMQRLISRLWLQHEKWVRGQCERRPPQLSGRNPGRGAECLVHTDLHLALKVGSAAFSANQASAVQCNSDMLNWTLKFQMHYRCSCTL
ncbi:hypothetical protein M758_11G108200 [Ceratodon purpureus]|nr:hypothetical protein M758_11G108200 [Ceratodon purpureus]